MLPNFKNIPTFSSNSLGVVDNYFLQLHKKPKIINKKDQGIPKLIKDAINKEEYDYITG